MEKEGSEPLPGSRLQGQAPRQAAALKGFPGKSGEGAVLTAVADNCFKTV